LGTTLQGFLQSIGANFDLLVTTENGKTTKSLNDLNASLTADITTVLNAAKDANVKDVTEQSLLVKGQATSDLIKEINRVKKLLADEVASQKTTAQGKVDAHLTAEVARINGLLTTLISGLETTAKTAIETAGSTVEQSAYDNFDRVISLTQTETPIKVDPQKLKWEAGKFIPGAFDGKIKFKVTNTNEFDVVFRYRFVSLDSNQGGVSETPFAENNAKPGVTEFTFDNIPFPAAGAGTLYVEYLDENGAFKYGAEFGLY
ncbi:hypothetical protein V7111_27050, partial [Neobacillus niacini]|uniref:hypothetical protein n=1 Tax=Neobacillus niacini TaxID=86668 RepID=UPI003003306F